MRQQYIFICVALLISLLIYLFYRTENTLVTLMFIKLISLDNYLMIREYVLKTLPLHPIIIYSLPEGLWVFCITLTSKSHYINLFRWRLSGVFIPLIFCLVLEIFQLLQITNGKFDFMDILTCVVFWILGIMTFEDKVEKQNILSSPNAKSLICIASYCIVYLAHVFK